MNRRSFLTSLIKGAVGCAILPSAVTYARTWKKPTGNLILQGDLLICPNPAYINAPFEMAFILNAELIQKKCWFQNLRFNTAEDARLGINSIPPFIEKYIP